MLHLPIIIIRHKMTATLFFAGTNSRAALLFDSSRTTTVKLPETCVPAGSTNVHPASSVAFPKNTADKVALSFTFFAFTVQQVPSTTVFSAGTDSKAALLFDTSRTTTVKLPETCVPAGSTNVYAASLTAFSKNTADKGSLLVAFFAFTVQQVPSTTVFSAGTDSRAALLFDTSRTTTVKLPETCVPAGSTNVYAASLTAFPKNTADNGSLLVAFTKKTFDKTLLSNNKANAFFSYFPAKNNK